MVWQNTNKYFPDLFFVLFCFKAHRIWETLKRTVGIDAIVCSPSFDFEVLDRILFILIFKCLHYKYLLKKYGNLIKSVKIVHLSFIYLSISLLIK